MITTRLLLQMVPDSALHRFWDLKNIALHKILYILCLLLSFLLFQTFLSIDLALVEDPKFKIWAEKYYKDEEFWFKDFANYYQQLNELGLETWKLYSEVPWYKFW
jgi:hypothetical protein